ncbi:methyltransferase [Candidatus Mycoplasma haematominutum]|uniref:Uncharacterized protein n=1 Tax=Candidatus Mycoplasma haematominutum 'Birmingham 1' TaxID=1116213 RepID=G8C401_9MOLU|nr:methyltransferase [Candidatus Mycoplasma haematominutum]CCE67049.1 conserved hypothetical protein (modificationmethylase, HemK family) [Candidatus Mycoplasma haematominutum 'Birmingham 1']
MPRAFDTLFSMSNRVKNFNDYVILKDNTIDFLFKPNSKFRSKIIEENYPIPRLTKKVFFNNNELLVNPGVFIPRTETECLVKITQEWISRINLSDFSYIDLCSGTGNILISLLDKYRDNIYRYSAVDASYTSCKNVLENIQLKKYTSKGDVYCTNWTQFLKENSHWELITMNPPYIGKNEFTALNKSTNLYKYDPKWALQSEETGFSHYSKIIEFAVNNSYWKLIILECSEFHESNWKNLDLTSKNIQINRYYDHLNKFRVVVLNRM